uniref:Transcriptional regulator n=1 Tax=Desulfovibrio sp. U5L TaxID=596152 RepID=I2PWN2_9BACT
MPVLSVFFGIVVTMYWREHNPPHFHAAYGEAEAIVSIETLEVLRGSLPRRALAMVLEWAAEHRAELMENWQLCQAFSSPQPIAPLE